MRAVISVLDQVHSEIQRATAKHGPMTTSHEALGVIMEEFDEFKAEVYRQTFDKVAAKKELIQVAAMCIRAIVDLGMEPKDGKETPYDR